MITKNKIKLTPHQLAILHSQDNIISLNQHNRSLLLNLKKQWDPTYIHQALSLLVKQHEMFRTKFLYTNDEWQADSVAFEEFSPEDILTVVDLDEFIEDEQSEIIEYLCSNAQKGLDILTGELIKVIYFQRQRGSKLFITINRLICDAASLTVLVNEFYKYYKNLQENTHILTDCQTSSFVSVEKLLDKFILPTLSSEKIYWQNGLKDKYIGSLPFDNIDFDSNRERDTAHYNAVLSSALTSQLLDQCLGYYTSTIELLLAALVKTFEKITGQAKIRVEMEGILTSIPFFQQANKDRLINNFAYSYPLTLSAVEESQWPDLIKTVKEEVRKVPHQGLGFQFLKYHQKDKEIIALTQNSETWVKFSFENTSLKDHSLFYNDFSEELSIPTGEESSEEALRVNILSFQLKIADEQLKLTIDYNKKQYHEETIANISYQYLHFLESIIEHVSSLTSVRHTPSDFPLVNLNQLEIDHLQFKYGIIENILPLSAEAKENLNTRFSSSQPLSELSVYTLNNHLNHAEWLSCYNDCIKRRVALRSVFYGNTEGYNQVVLSTISASIPYLDLRSIPANQQQIAFEKYLNEIDRDSITVDKEQLFHMHLIDFSDQHTACIVHHHCIIEDALSVKEILSELLVDYNQRKNSSVTITQSYIKESIKKTDSFTGNKKQSADPNQYPEKPSASYTFDHTIRSLNVRGFSVNFNRIESELLRIEMIQEALAVYESTEKKTHAYIQLVTSPTENTKDLTTLIRSQLSKSLPSYMMPDAFFIVDSFDQLTVPSSGDAVVANNLEEHSAIVLPRNEMEELLIKCWQKILGVEQISIHDRFFALGGNSLKVTQVYSTIRDQGLPISLMDLFECSTIAEISERVQTQKNTIQLKTSDNVKGMGCLLPFHMTYLNTFKKNSWNLSSVYYFRDGLNVSAMESVIQRIHEYHDALRITFSGELISTNNLRNFEMRNHAIEEFPISFTIQDWRDLNEDEFAQQVAFDIHQTEIATVYDSPQLSNYKIYRSKAGDHFYFSVSHLICDGVSFQLLSNDILNWYNILSNEQELHLPRKTDSYILACQKLYEYAISPDILNEMPNWEDAFLAFNQNSVLPKDQILTAADKKSKNYTFIEEELVSIAHLDELEKRCVANETTMIDLLTMAFGQAVKNWSGINEFGAFFLSAGRSYPELNLDLSRTIGCLAYTVYVKIDTANEELTLWQKATAHKKAREAFPNGSVGGCLLLNLNYYKGPDFYFPVEKTPPAGAPVICINYFEKGIETSTAQTRKLEMSPYGKSGRGINPEADYSNLFDLTFNHSDTSIQFKWSYNQLEYKEETIKGLMKDMNRLLIQLAQ